VRLAHLQWGVGAAAGADDGGQFDPLRALQSGCVRGFGDRARDGGIPANHGIAAEQGVGLQRQRALGAIGDEADRGHGDDREHQRRREDAHVAGGDVPAQLAPGESGGPHSSATRRPLSRRRRRPQRAARCSSWVTSTRVVPASWLSANSSSMIASPVWVSRLPVGSSANSSEGSVTEARARAARCCSPPASCRGWWPRRCPSPTFSRMARAGPSASRSPRNSSGSITFSSAVSEGSSWKLWNTKPTLSPRTLARPSSSSCASAAPSRCTVPSLGRSRPASRESRVLLPEPEAPTTATVSPCSMRKSTSSRMTSSPSGRETRLPSPWALRAEPCPAKETSVKMRSSKVSDPAMYPSRYAAPRPGMQWAIGLFVLLLAFAAVASPGRTVLVMGDSLSAGYGMAASQGWVSLLGERLHAGYPGWTVVNA